MLILPAPVHSKGLFKWSGLIHARKWGAGSVADANPPVPQSITLGSEGEPLFSQD